MSAAGEAEPSQGPKGASLRDCRKADTCSSVPVRHAKEVEA
jgi:hypothetical protein